MKQRIMICLFSYIVLLFPLVAEGAIQCYECHGTSSPVDYRPLDASYRTISSGAFQGNHRTHLSAPASNTACTPCHPGSDTYVSSHSSDRSRMIKVSGRINGSPLATPYNSTTSAFSQRAAPTPGSCNNVNCHFEATTPAWGSDPAATTCATCHGAPPTGTAPSYAGGAAGSHVKHDTYYSGANNCVKCHSDHTVESLPFAHATSAGKRGLVVAPRTPGNTLHGTYSVFSPITSYLPSQAASHQARFGSCQATYCHGSTMDQAGDKNGGTNITPTWGNSATGQCGTCHGATSGNPPKRGSHQTHAGSGQWYWGTPGDLFYSFEYMYGRGLACTVCHNNYDPRHVNGSADWSYDSTTRPWLSGARYRGISSGSASPVPGAYGQCTNLYCHSIVQSSNGGPLTGLAGEYKAPTWGNRLEGKCGACHAADIQHAQLADAFQYPFSTYTAHQMASGSHRKHLAVFAASADFGPAGAVAACAACHNYVGTDNFNSCANLCHDNQGLHVNHQIDILFPPKYGGGSATYNGSLLPGNGFSSCSSLYCHSSGTSVSTGTVSANTTPVWGSGALACNGCHGNKSYTDYRKAFPLYTTNRPNTKANSHKPHLAYSCEKCHYNTTTDGVTITNQANHANKVYNVDAGPGTSFTYSYNASGGSCNSISCHSTTGAQWGSTSCLGCHSVAQGNRVAVGLQFGANSHHIQGTITDAQCYQCHWEANSDGSINPAYHHSGTSGAPVELVVYGAGARPFSYAVGTTAVQYHYTTTVNRAGVQKITTHCLGCHSDQNNTATPFGDGRTPRWYAWDETDTVNHNHNGTSVAARYSQSGTTSWGKYTSASYPNAAKKKITKAFSAHGNTSNNQRGWDTTNGVDGTISNTSGAVSVQCYDCHNSHGSTAAGITSRYSSATGRQNGAILKDTVAGKGGYGVAYKPYTGGSAANKNRRNPGASICLDCHMTQTAGSTMPWGYNSTFGATQPILGYWDSPYYGPGTFGSQARYSYKTTGAMGGHLGASSSLSKPASMAIGGLCTPCHDPHGVSPTLAGDQKYGVPLLKGTYVTSPYKEDVSPTSTTELRGNRNWAGGSNPEYHIDQNTFSGITEADTQFAGLCLNCHSKPNLTNGTDHTWRGKDRIHESVKGWKTANGTTKHNYSCSKCHTPHNSNLPRLMVTNCLDYGHRGKMAAGGFPGKYSSGGSGCGGGSGSGQFPGGGGGSGGGCGYGTLYSASYVFGGIPCHDSTNSDAWPNNQVWNTKTTWGALSPPTAISATPGNGQATFYWTAGTAPNTSLIRYGTASGAYGTTIDPVVSPLTIYSLANGQTIYYQVGIKNGAGTSWSAEYTVTPTASAPSPVTAVSSIAGNTQATFFWTAGSGSTSSLLRYGTVTGVYMVSIDPAPTGRIITSLTNGQTIYYQVGARNASGTTWGAEYSVIPTASAPSAPTLTAATAGNAQVSISWAAGSGSISSLVSYGPASETYTTTIDPATSALTMNSLANSTTIYFRIGAKNGAGITWGNQFSLTPTASAPLPATSISATPANGQGIISWTAGSGSTSSLLRYGTTSGTYTTTISSVVSPRTINGPNGTPIYYQVGANNASGTTWSSEYSVTPMAAPTAISATPGNGQATISWTAGAGSTSSLVRYGTSSGSYGAPIDPAVSGYTITSLTNGQTIYYQVGAKNGSGTIWSGEYTVLPTASAPSAATAISATHASGQVTITWTAGAGSTLSIIRYGTTSGTYTTTISSAVSPRTISGLTNGTTIYYRVGAQNGSGTTWSSEYSVIPGP